MVDEWDVRTNITHLLSSLYSSGSITLEDIRDLFDNNHWEAQSSYAWSGTTIIKDMLKKYVGEQNGKKCIVTADASEATKAESFGWSSVRVPKSLADAFGSLLSSDYHAEYRKEIGLSTFAEMTNELRDSVAEVYDNSTLSLDEASSLTWATEVLAGAGVIVEPSVVRFVRDGEILGLYKSGDIFIAKSMLADKVEALSILVHEYAHNFGGDGTIAHSSAIESLWTKIAKSHMR